VRCADGILMEVTAGDVLYVAKGTARRFENLSGKFLTLRLP
jgi:mannose-6-phosphate isomerase-like protein (cupin superfamily)